MKVCKNAKGMTAKSKLRWNQEVQFLKNIKHHNVIQAFPLPEGLKCFLDRPDGLPALCMEYCEGGDLRKVLKYIQFTRNQVCTAIGSQMFCRCMV